MSGGLLTQQPGVTSTKESTETGETAEVAAGAERGNATERSEATDPYCLRSGEADALLAGHPWQRFVILGDSIAEGVGEPVPGYPPLPIAQRVTAELARLQPELAVLNLGRRNLRARQVRERQLAPALAFGPDLALVVCGANADPSDLPLD